MTLPFTLPSIKNGIIPLWEGNGFRIGDQYTKVLQYSINNLGWNDNLTSFHEENAGDQHFIDKASRDNAIFQLTKYLPKKNPIILEIGCSSGFMLQRLHKEFPHATLIGSDVVSDPLFKLADLLPTIPLFQFDLLNCPLPDNSVDAVVILNVLEHIEKDDTALKQIQRILKPGGIAVIEVPAGPHLYDIYDKMLLHYRRYAAKDLQDLIIKQGFKIIKKSHLGFFLYPGFRMVKQKNKRSFSEPHQIQQERVENNIRSANNNKFFNIIMKTEILLGRFISYPFGIRCLITCMK